MVSRALLMICFLLGYIMREKTRLSSTAPFSMDKVGKVKPDIRAMMIGLIAIGMIMTEATLCIGALMAALLLLP